MEANTEPREPIPWYGIFCPRPAEMTALQAAYEAAADTRSPRPGVIVLLSESGLGKTRLVQEFFHWLSTIKDGADDAGYWPDVLARHGDNLRVDPDPTACNHQVPLPFLWWGVRLPDLGRHNQIMSISVLASCADRFEPHVAPMLRARRGAERGGEVRRSTRDLVVEALLEGLGQLVPGVSLAKAGVVFTKRMSELWSDHRTDDRARLSPAEINENERQNLSDRYYDYLQAMLDGRQGFHRPVPFLFAIDDAQWAKEDPALLDLVDRLLPAAKEKHWPFLLIVTHWEAEWNAGSAMREIVERHSPPGWKVIKLSPHPDLSSCVAAAFPGLTAAQAEVILNKAGGNPRLLDEILRWLSARPRFFVDRNVACALTPEGEATVGEETFSLHRLVEDRLNAAPPEIKATLAVSGLQGMRFLTSLTEEVFAALRQAYPVRDAVARAEHPYSFVVRYGDAAAEFAQRVFHDVAVAGLPDIADGTAAREALAQAVRARIEGGLERLPADEIADTLAVAASVLEHDPNPILRVLAARALARLADLATERWDHFAALAVARRFEAGRINDRWRPDDFDVWELGAVLDALLVFEPPGRVEHLAFALLQRSRKLAHELRTLEARRDFSVSLERNGDIARAQGKLGEAETLYRESLEVARAQARELGTPQARRDLSVSYHKVGKLIWAQGKLDDAATLFREGLELRRVLARELRTPQARRDLSVSLGEVAHTVREHGQLGEAETLYCEGLDIARTLARELGTPGARRDLTVCCNDVGDIMLAQGKLRDAETLYREGLDLARVLARELRTPEARRDVSSSCNRVADIARVQGHLGAAEALYREALELRRVLARELGTWEARRDVSTSLERVGYIADAQGQLCEAENSPSRRP